MWETSLISSERVKEALTMEETIQAVEKTYSEYQKGRVLNPSKLTLDLGESGGWPHFDSFINAMPAYVDWTDLAGIKLVGGFWEIEDPNIPAIRGIIVLVHPANGHFKAILDGTYITGMRTGAQSAVGARYLCSSTPESIAIIGAGEQGRFQLRALDEEFPLQQVNVFDIDEEAIEQFINDVGQTTEATVKKCQKLKDACKADIVVTTTSARQPFIEREMIRENSLLISLGSYQEFSDEVIIDAEEVIVDHVGQSLHRGALKQLVENDHMSEEDINGTIGQVINNEYRPKQWGDRPTLFIPVGIGAVDLATAATAFDKISNGTKNTKFDFDGDSENRSG